VLPHDRNSWIAKAAVTFLHSGDIEGYTLLCRRFFGAKSGAEPGFPVEVLTMTSEELPDHLRSKLVRWDESHMAEGITGSAPTPELKYLNLTRLGLVRSRLGRHEQGLESLEMAMEDTYYPRALLATGYAAITAHHMDDPEAATRYLKEAQDGWSLLFDAAGGRLHPEWVDQAMLHLALIEARELIRKPARISSALTLTH